MRTRLTVYNDPPPAENRSPIGEPQSGSAPTAEQQLPQWYHAIFHHSFQFAFIVSPEGRLLEMNQTAVKFAGIRVQDVLGKFFMDMPWWSASGKNSVEAALFRASGGEFIRYTTEFIGFEGAIATVDFSIKPVFSEMGEITFFVAEGRDITALKKAEFERDREKQSADNWQKLNELKNDFLSSVSHELRTPLASIIGFAQTLLRDLSVPQATAQKFLTIILQDGQRLSRLVEDLLDLSRIESGHIELQRTKINIAEIVEYAIHLSSPNAAAKHIHLCWDTSQDPVFLYLDRDRITQVLVNLLDNAIKFTPEQGAVSVTIAHLPDGYVMIVVADTGIGIPAEELPRLFEKFYRIRQKGHEVRGTGLGLAIARQCVELHGGKIDIESTVGSGSKFMIILPSPE